MSCTLRIPERHCLICYTDTWCKMCPAGTLLCRGRGRWGPNFNVDDLLCRGRDQWGPNFNVDEPLPLSVVLVLVCSLPNVTPSAPRRRASKVRPYARADFRPTRTTSNPYRWSSMRKWRNCAFLIIRSRTRVRLDRLRSCALVVVLFRELS